DLHGADAVGEDPEEVGQVSGDDAALALGAEEDDGLLGEGPAGAGVPEGGGAAGAVLAEEAVGVTVEFGVAGPLAEPVRGLIGGAEGVVGLEVDALAVGVVDADAGQVREGGREAAVVAVGLGHVGTVTGRTDIRSSRKPVGRLHVCVAGGVVLFALADMRSELGRYVADALGTGPRRRSPPLSWLWPTV